MIESFKKAFGWVFGFSSGIVAFGWLLGKVKEEAKKEAAKTKTEEPKTETKETETEEDFLK